MTYKELSGLCRKWRTDREIPQSKIADIAGTSVQAVSQFESGRCNSLRIYCAYLSAGFVMPAGETAFVAMAPEVFGNGKK